MHLENLWCQFRPEFDPKRLNDLGPFHYAFTMLENDRRDNPGIPVLFTTLNQKNELEAIFILKTVFAPRTSSPPDLTPTAKTRKAVGFWLQSKKLGQVVFPYRCFLFEDTSTMPLHLQTMRQDYIEKVSQMLKEKENGKSNVHTDG
ncbi:hypothetical protein D9757_012353 [Collybiopsis confluens]|uniref:Uncharacterized protein n=1 Tax=Collybiopsis confluens TaxID=2823264 RepID=A0A8H5G380_9AGAR|nr:hypothetical protein D9757_012353 [Collybiopsis confluens]